MGKREYFASKPPSEMAAEIFKRYDDYRDFVHETGIETVWHKVQEKYYRGIRIPGVRAVGNEGEYSAMHVNHLRNFVKHLQVTITGQRPNFEARATNTDHESQAQTILANSLLEFYIRDQKVEKNLNKAVEHALIYGEGFVIMRWDTTEGEDIQLEAQEDVPGQPKSPRIQKTGDVVITNAPPHRVARDVAREGDAPQDWYIVQTQANRFDLAAKFPELKEKILALPSILEEEDVDFDREFRQFQHFQSETDDVRVLEFFHRRSDALPEGRNTMVLSDDLVLLDGGLPYDEMPVYRVSASETFGTPFGYTVIYDLLGIQESIDLLYSSILTNQKAHGVQNIAIPRGSNIQLIALGSGMNAIEYDAKGGLPTALQLTETAPEIFKFLETLERVAETISGVNAVSRGNPQSSLESGAALALVQNQTIQFSLELQQSYVRLLESVGTAIIGFLQTFGEANRTATITGITNQQYLEEFNKEQLSMVKRVTVDSGNPMTRTTAGKVNLAEQLLKAGLVKNPEQFIQVLTTGNLQPLIEGAQSQLMLIRSENEQLSKGEPVKALMTDDHAKHVAEHASVISSVQARENGPAVEQTLTHIAEHLMLFQAADPVLLAILGQQPPPPTPEAAQAAGPPGQPPAGGLAAGANGAADALDAGNPVTEQANSIAPPNPPTNPVSGLPTSGIAGQELGDTA